MHEILFKYLRYDAHKSHQNPSQSRKYFLKRFKSMIKKKLTDSNHNFNSD